MDEHVDREALVAAARRWLASPEGRACLQAALDAADRAVRELEEKRRLDPDWRDFWVTI